MFVAGIVKKNKLLTIRRKFCLAVILRKARKPIANILFISKQLNKNLNGPGIKNGGSNEELDKVIPPNSQIKSTCQ